MDNKIPDNHLSFNDPINWKSLGFFSVEDYLIYIFKKTEKITAALYLVSGLLKDNEPLKWELRDRGIDLLSSSFAASSSLPGDKSIVIQSLFSVAFETISLLNVAKISNLISDMNYKIVMRELDHIIGMLRDRLVQNAENAGYVLSDDFFKTPNLFTPRPRSLNLSDNFNSNSKSIFKPSKISVHEKKSQRQNLIINVLKGQSGLTIKDFSKVIKDCSEKTIQRELLELVNKGLVSKEGKRRWSRYSLKTP